jgi:hypothetical protein
MVPVPGIHQEPHISIFLSTMLTIRAQRRNVKRKSTPAACAGSAVADLSCPAGRSGALEISIRSTTLRTSLPLTIARFLGAVGDLGGESEIRAEPCPSVVLTCYESFENASNLRAVFLRFSISSRWSTHRADHVSSVSLIACSSPAVIKAICVIICSRLLTFGASSAQ